MNARTDTRPMGLVLDMAFEDYLAVEAFSNSDMKLLARSPWHWKNRIPVEQTRPMLRGALVHCAQLEPDAVGARYVYVPEDAPKRPTPAQWAAKQSNESSTIAKEWWAKFNAYAEERQVVEFKDMEVARAQVAAINAEPTLAPLFATGHSEVSIFWIDPSTGVYCKARPDHVHYTGAKNATLLDLKSTADDSPRGFGRTVAALGYHRQRAHYIDGFQIATGRKVDEFIFAAVSSAPPVLAVPYLLPDDFAQQGVDEVRELIELYALCVASNTWPSYGSGCLLADIPAYANRANDIEVAFAED